MGIENMISNLYEIFSIVLVPVFIVGSLNCFFGYKLHKVVNCILGFVYSAMLGILLAILAGFSEGAVMVAALVMGIIGALLANVFYIIGVFISSFFTGFIIGVITMILSKSYTSMIGIGVVCGLLFGLIACFAIKYMIIIVTAFMGAIQMSLSLMLLFRNKWIGIMSAIVLFALGILTQYALTKKKRITTSTQTQTQEVVPQEHIGNTQTVNVMPAINENLVNSRQKTLRSLFSDDIYQEIKYVFSNQDTRRIIYMPIFDEENWICTCGNENTNVDCIYCGMNRTELQEKINYQFLKQHKKERLENLEKERELKKEQIAEDINRTIVSAKNKTAEIVEQTKTSSEKYYSILGEKCNVLWKNINKWMICIEDFFMKHRKIIMSTATGLVLIITIIYYVVHNPTCSSEESVEAHAELEAQIAEPEAENAQLQEKPLTEQPEVSAVEEPEETMTESMEENVSADTESVLDAFINNEIPLSGEKTLYYNELMQEELAELGERVDLDNDGERELIITGIYGGYYLDVRDGKVWIFAQGGGTGMMLHHIEYDGATWIYYADTSHVGRQVYDFEKYEGGDNLVDSFDLNYEYWGDAHCVCKYRGQEISKVEYDKIFAGIFGVKKDEVTNEMPDLEAEIQNIRNIYYSTQENLNSFEVSSCEVNDAVIVRYNDKNTGNARKLVAPKGTYTIDMGMGEALAYYSAEYCYDEKEQLVFVFVYDEDEEYRYYVKDDKCIRYIDNQGAIKDYPEGATSGMIADTDCFIDAGRNALYLAGSAIQRIQ